MDFKCKISLKKKSLLYVVGTVSVSTYKIQKRELNVVKLSINKTITKTK